jgi:hypothetical protein
MWLKCGIHGKMGAGGGYPVPNRHSGPRPRGLFGDSAVDMIGACPLYNPNTARRPPRPDGASVKPFSLCW